MDFTILIYFMALNVIHGNMDKNNEPCKLIRKETKLIADCSHRSLTSFPVDWDPDVEEVDLSYNLLRRVTGREISYLPSSVTRLDLSHNHIHEVHNYTFQHLSKLQVPICKHSNFI